VVGEFDNSGTAFNQALPVTPSWTNSRPRIWSRAFHARDSPRSAANNLSGRAILKRKGGRPSSVDPFFVSIRGLPLTNFGPLEHHLVWSVSSTTRARRSIKLLQSPRVGQTRVRAFGPSRSEGFAAVRGEQSLRARHQSDCEYVLRQRGKPRASFRSETRAKVVTLSIARNECTLERPARCVRCIHGVVMPRGSVEDDQ